MDSDTPKPKQLPPLLTDEEAERFADEADLSDYDLSGFKLVRFELKKKDRTVSLRLSDDLLQGVKDTAAAEGIPYQRFMRDAIERAVRGVLRRKEMKKKPEDRPPVATIVRQPVGRLKGAIGFNGLAGRCTRVVCA